VSTYGPSAFWKTGVELLNPVPGEADIRNIQSLKVFCTLDYLRFGCGLLFMQCVDLKDQETNNNMPPYKQMWMEEILVIREVMTNYSTFSSRSEGLLAFILDNYSHVASIENSVKTWLKQLKRAGKTVFLITSNLPYFTKFNFETLLGEDWMDYFDFVLTYGKKPDFFCKDSAFTYAKYTTQPPGITYSELEDKTTLEPKTIYCDGNFAFFKNVLKKHTGKENPEIVVFGDNAVEDLYAPHVYAGCDTVAVIAEMNESTDKDSLNKNLWGSYLFDFHRCSKERTTTIWNELLKAHSKLVIPSLEAIAHFPLDHTFYEQSDDDSFKIYYPKLKHE
jgi:FMN phosphatase YigB (HAD superfamily)